MSQQQSKKDESLPARTGSITRERIMSAALIEFAQHGLSGARVDQIAKRAGVNKAMIYYHFSSKAALHQEIVDENFFQILTRIHKAFSNSDLLEDVLFTLVNAYAEAFSSRPEIRLIFLRGLADAESEMINRFADTIIASGLPKQIVNSFKAGIDQGLFRPVDVRQAFISLLSMNVGYILLAPLLDKVWDISNHDQFIAERKDAIIDLFLHGVKIK